MAEFNDKLSSLLEHNVYMQNGSLHHKNDPKDLYYRYSQILMMRYALLSLDRIKDWQLMYPEDARRPENPFKSRSASSAENFYKKMLTSAMSYYPVGLNCYPGVHSIEHRILYSEFVEDYLRYYKVLTESQRQTVEALFILLRGRQIWLQTDGVYRFRYRSSFLIILWQKNGQIFMKRN